MLYFDTAYIAKCYLNEPGAPQVRQLASSAPGLASSEFARLEFFAVLHRQLREGKLTQAQIQQIAGFFRQDAANGVWRWLPLTSALLDQACQHFLSLPGSVYLRTADALHLTCASHYKFQAIYTNDSHLLAAAQHFNLTGINVI